jgi:citrate synthase
MGQSSLSVTDNRTGHRYELPIEHGAIRATDLRRMKTGPADFGLLSYDPAFMNTASCASTITSSPSRGHRGGWPSGWR